MRGGALKCAVMQTPNLLVSSVDVVVAALKRTLNGEEFEEWWRFWEGREGLTLYLTLVLQ